MKKNTIKNLFIELGYEPENMILNQEYDVSHLNYEINSRNINSNIDEFSRILKIVRKNDDEEYCVETDKNLFYCTGEHKIYVKYKEKFLFEKIISLIGNEDLYKVYTTDGWKNFKITKTNKNTMVLDLEVEKNHCYYTNNILSHNTLYGSPITTPGGLAIPYASSVRVSLNGGKHIEHNGQAIGIEVTAKIIKNKISRPFRECTFTIIFGSGIVEHEQLFDLLRQYCDTSKQGVPCGNKLVKVEGTGAWKVFSIIDAKTGVVEKEVKFYKADFGNTILDNPEYKKYVNALLDAALIMRPEAKEHLTYSGVATTDTQEMLPEETN